MLKILLVEDAPEYQTLVSRALQGKAQVVIAATLAAARASLNEHEFDLLLVDYMLPDGNGIDLCIEVQQNIPAAVRPPIVMLTAKNELQDRLVGWSAGIDDYIQKPFHPLELEVRLLSRARRNRDRNESGQELVCEDLSLNLTFHEATLDIGGEKHKLDLTPHEFKILHFLLKNRDRVLTRSQIIEFAWGEKTFITERAVDKHVSQLRAKLGPNAYQLKTVVGLGYRFIPKRIAA